MKHRIIEICVIIIYSFVLFPMKGQTVNYYKLHKIEDYGRIDSRCNGGQFVYINRNLCFDSDSQGNDVGNGKLYRDVNNSSTNYIYKGPSYYGLAKYIFSHDYKNLIVEITPHFRYLYSLETPPYGVTTSSLIKPARSSSSETEIIPKASQTGFNDGYFIDSSNFTSESNSNSHSNSHSNTNIPARTFKCAYCNGTGQIERNDNAPANFGINKPRQRCNDCGKWYDPNVFTHYHLRCYHCDGTGFAK